ncbi:MAG: hypothetical protein GYA55_10115 [SAR324 cluster bacterium]|uniref:Uncharacterized protein n=1 Tax=SAR324 cluster bacterium TaxID=2024889 RepID=A0A7X9FT91_9DELT|nr:hypothetical protein [SAR324 cluster bacterium]
MPEQPSFSESKFAEPDPNWGLDTLYFFHSSDKEVRDRLRDPGKYYGDLSLDQERGQFTLSDERAGNTQTEQGAFQTFRSTDMERKSLEVEQAQKQHPQVKPGFPRLYSRYRHEYAEFKCDLKLMILDMSVLAATIAVLNSSIDWLSGIAGVGYCLWRISRLK